MHLLTSAILFFQIQRKRNTIERHILGQADEAFRHGGLLDRICTEAQRGVAPAVAGIGPHLPSVYATRRGSTKHCDSSAYHIHTTQAI